MKNIILILLSLFIPTNISAQVIPWVVLNKEVKGKRYCPANPFIPGDTPEICDVEWNINLLWKIEEEKLKIKVSIYLEKVGGVTDLQLNPKKTFWKMKIEEVWSEKSNLIKNPGVNQEVLPINVEVCWVDIASEADYIVKVHPSPQNNKICVLNWALNMDDTWEIEDVLAANPLYAPHEFGHMLGAYDEYSGDKGWRHPDDVTVSPLGEADTDEASIMASGEGKELRLRHFDYILQHINETIVNDEFEIQIDSDSEPINEDGSFYENTESSEFAMVLCYNDIPTLSQWGLIILGLLTLIIGIVSIRQEEKAIA